MSLPGQQIPIVTTTGNSVKSTMILDNVRLGFRFYWNGFSDRWYMDILDPITEVPFLAGLGLSLGVNLFARHSYLVEQGKLPPGSLFVLDLTGTGIDPKKAGFSTGDYTLIYLPLEG